MCLANILELGRLPCNYYWVKLINDDVTVTFFDGREFSCCKDFGIKEILAPCDYEELKKYKSLAENGESAIKRLSDKYKELEEELKKVKEELNESGKESAGFEMDLYDANRWNKYLLDLLRECKEFLKNYSKGYFEDNRHFIITNDDIECDADDAHDLLIRINAAIGEEE